MVVLTAVVNVANGKGEEFESEFHKLALKVRKDPGAIAYVLHRHAMNRNQYLVYEKYKDDEAVKYHGSTPHFQEFLKKATRLRLGLRKSTFIKKSVFKIPPYP